MPFYVHCDWLLSAAYCFKDPAGNAGVFFGGKGLPANQMVLRFLVEEERREVLILPPAWMVDVLMSTAEKLLIRDYGSPYITYADFDFVSSGKILPMQPGF